MWMTYPPPPPPTPLFIFILRIHILNLKFIFPKLVTNPLSRIDSKKYK